MTKISKFLGATTIAASLGFLATAAQATPIVPGTPVTTPPPSISANGDVKAMYIFSDAGDDSTLSQIIPPFGLIFCNHSTGSCTAATTFQTVDLGVENGVLQFSLHNVSEGTTYLSDTPDGDGNYHAFFTNNFADITGVAAPAGLAAAVAALGGTVTYVAWEDKNQAEGTDWDYNDLIFAFSNTQLCTDCGTNDVPEPLTLSLFGAGLAGAAAFRRRRKSKNPA